MEKRNWIDECLERASEATPITDFVHKWSDDGEDHALTHDSTGTLIYCNYRYVDLFKNASMDVPELARRLKDVRQRLKNISNKAMHAAMFDCDPLAHDDLSEIESECFDAIYELERDWEGGK